MTLSLRSNPKLIIVGLLVFSLSLGLSPALAQDAKDEQKAKKKEEEKTVKITEEILVVGKAPKDVPLATVSTVVSTDIEKLKPRDLSDVLKFIPGSMITFGDKDTYSLKLRGIGSNRIALLVDGVPVYEPYFSTFDLKTVSAGGIDTVQVTKGPSSVLYGPNTLGGLVNVITKRPTERPSLSLSGSYGDEDTKSLGLDTSYSWKRFALLANALYQDSAGFYYPNPEDGQTLRANSDFERLNLNAKLYYTPSSSTEIMVNGGLYQSEYGMPAALFTQRARYWRFPKWDRSTLNAGGFTSLGGDATLRFRGFYVNYVNTLDWYADPEMTELDSQSTYDNSVYGGFALADLPTGDMNTVKASLIYQKDVARIQDDAGLPWNKVDQGTLSAGLEDHFSITDKWKVIGGLSLDYIDKFAPGENNTSVNPLVGVKFTPTEALDFHVSFARKSRFPSMRSMYSQSSGNPDLLSESGTSFEFATTWNGPLYVTGSVFFNRFKNFIDTVRLPDGTRRYFNIGKAHINGFEVQVQKNLSWLSGTANYTYLDHRNDTDGRPLDAQPKHNLNFDVSVIPAEGFRVGFYGLLGSTSWWYNSSTSTVLTIPSYFSLDAIASYAFNGRYEIFLRLGNVFDDYFYTEPGFPWRGRYLEIGVKVDVLK
ncbi:MAG: TonB-dependent receptor [Candidatus Aminicenantes bacterium]|nr:TonB-dependent receptor [Candidatus Aminicenantes bacterium]